MSSFMTTSSPSNCFPWWEQEIGSGIRVRDVLNVEGDDDPRVGPRRRLTSRVPVWLRLLNPAEESRDGDDAIACVALRELMYLAFRDSSGEWTRWDRGELPLRVEGTGKHHVEHIWDTKPLVHRWLAVAWSGMQRYTSGGLPWSDLVESLVELGAFLAAGPTAIQAAVPEAVNAAVMKAIHKSPELDGFKKYTAAGFDFPLYEGVSAQESHVAMARLQEIISDSTEDAFATARKRLGVERSDEYPRLSQASAVTDEEATVRLAEVIDEAQRAGLNLKQRGGLYLVYGSKGDRISGSYHEDNPHQRPRGDGPISPVTCGLKRSNSITVEARIASCGDRNIPFYEQEVDEMVNRLEPLMTQAATQNGWGYRRDGSGRTKVRLKLQWTLPPTASPFDVVQAHRQLDFLMWAAGWR